MQKDISMNLMQHLVSIRILSKAAKQCDHCESHCESFPQFSKIIIYLNASRPLYLLEKSGLRSKRKSLKVILATDFCISLQYGEWKHMASMLSSVKLVPLFSVKNKIIVTIKFLPVPCVLCL